MACLADDVSGDVVILFSICFNDPLEVVFRSRTCIGFVMKKKYAGDFNSQMKIHFDFS